jgi:hypothetical protein
MASATTRPTAVATSQPSARVLAQIKEMERYYAKLYAEPLNSPDRLPREIAIVSLSRINCTDTTQRLLDVFKSKDRDPVVWYLAWEAIHSRISTLGHEDRRRWATGGLIAANLGGFPGTTVVPLLHALAEHHPVEYEAEPHKLAFRIIQENELKAGEGKEALDALRVLVATWHDPTMIRAMISSLTTRPDWADRVDYVLGNLPDVPKDTKKRPPVWWAGWQEKHSSMKVAAPEDLKQYAGTGKVFAPPVKILDPNDKRWTQELEIGKVTVSDFDLVWCIDSTGSMHETNQLVASETAVVIRVCSLISRKARCGTIYFRHELEPGLMQECCIKAKSNPKFYSVKGYPLTPDGKALAAKMAAERIPPPDKKNEGNTHPGGAFFSALKAAMELMNWSTDKQAKRLIVIIGDSFLTPGSEKACVQLAGEAKAKGFQLQAIIKGSAIGSWDEAVKAGGSEPVILGNGSKHVAAGQDINADFRSASAAAIRQSVAAPYRDRIDPLLKSLMPYAKELNASEIRLARGKSDK